jgi:long-chain fatty acid transport protein
LLLINGLVPMLKPLIRCKDFLPCSVFEGEISPIPFDLQVKTCNRILLLLLFFIHFYPGLPLNALADAIDEEVLMSSSPNPVGSGARALGMGGAFIAIADDATAAAWNPAGLIQLELPEISVVGAWAQKNNDFTYTAFPKASGPQKSETGNLNYLSAVSPFNLWGHNMVVSLNYQHLYDFSQDNSYHYAKHNKFDGLVLTQDVDVVIEMDGSLRTISPAFAIQLIPGLSMGATLNIWKDPLERNEWRVRYNRKETGSVNGNVYNITGETIDEYKFSGENFHLGLLWDINSIFTMGLVFKSPFSADLTRSIDGQKAISYPEAPGNDTSTSSHFSEEQSMNMPMSYGIGLSARINDRFSMALDIYRTHWDDYSIETGGITISPITGGSFDQADIDSTTQVRIGTEYLFIRPKMVIPIRAGFFYDPEPAPGKPDDFFGLTVGSGISWHHINLDISYQYRFGNRAYTRLIGNETSYRDVEQHTIFSSLIYHF